MSTGSSNRKRFVLSLLLALGVSGIAFGFADSTTGDERLKLPAEIESIRPVGNVQKQTDIFVDLAEGYTGTLTIDGITPPVTDRSEVADGLEAGQQAVIPPNTLFESGNFTLTFTPSPQAAISELSQGDHTVTVVYWRIADGPGSSEQYTWTFSTY